MAASGEASAAVDVSADSAGDTSMDKEKDDILNYNFIVALRVRPLLSRELQQDAQSIIKLLDNRVVCVLDPEKLKVGGQEDYLRRDRNRERQFTYDIAFNELANILWRECCRALILLFLPTAQRARARRTRCSAT